MAKLSMLKGKVDKTNRVIKCLIVEDYKSGNVYKYYNKNQFDEIIKTTDSMFLTKVYSPTQDEREFVFKFIQERTNDNKVEISESDILTVMFEKFTDLELDSNLDDALIVPNEFLLQIKGEIDKILISCIESRIDLQKTLATAPKVTEFLAKQIEAKKDVVDEEKLKRQKEREELELKIKELEKQAKELVD